MTDWAFGVRLGWQLGWTGHYAAMIEGADDSGIWNGKNGCHCWEANCSSIACPTHTEVVSTPTEPAKLAAVDFT